MPSSQFNPARLPMLPPSTAGTEESGGNTVANVHTDRTPSVRPDWSLGNPVPPMSSNVADNPLSDKRHRSMTPNLPPPGRTSLTKQQHVSLQPSSSYLGASRYHPYASSTVYPGPHPYIRAASLNSSAFLSRTPGYDGYTTDHTSQDPLNNTSKEAHPFASFATMGYVTNPNSPSYGLGDMISGADEVLPTITTRFQGGQSDDKSKDKEQNEWTEL
ncbi:hypothetical protein V866_007175 [Kwoniella sp. B9012]